MSNQMMLYKNQLLFNVTNIVPMLYNLLDHLNDFYTEVDHIDKFLVMYNETLSVYKAIRPDNYIFILEDWDTYEKTKAYNSVVQNIITDDLRCNTEFLKIQNNDTKEEKVIGYVYFTTYISHILAACRCESTLEFLNNYETYLDKSYNEAILYYNR